VGDREVAALCGRPQHLSRRRAKLQAEAIALGGPITYLDTEEGHKIEERRDYIRPWELWKRRRPGNSALMSGRKIATSNHHCTSAISGEPCHKQS
jgi:hypothetical protein